MNEKELQRQRIKHLVEQGGYVAPNEKFLCRRWLKYVLAAVAAIGVSGAAYIMAA